MDTKGTKALPRTILRRLEQLVLKLVWSLYATHTTATYAFFRIRGHIYSSMRTHIAVCGPWSDTYIAVVCGYSSSKVL